MFREEETRKLPGILEGGASKNRPVMLVLVLIAQVIVSIVVVDPLSTLSFLCLLSLGTLHMPGL